MTRVCMACKMSRYKKHTCFAGQTSRSWRRTKITWQDLQKQLKARCSDCWDSLKRNSNKITATMVCSWPLPQEKVDEALTQAAWRWNWERRWAVYQECYPLGALNPFNKKHQCEFATPPGRRRVPAASSRLNPERGETLAKTPHTSSPPVIAYRWYWSRPHPDLGQKGWSSSCSQGSRRPNFLLSLPR